MTALNATVGGLRTFGADVIRGLFEISHSGFAMVGLAVTFALLTLTVRPEIRALGEIQLIEWVHAQQIAASPSDNGVEPIDRATATDPTELPQSQASVAFWLSKKYRVAAEPISALVAEAYHIGQRSRLDATLILAVMAVESGFNPFAQSPVGAQGLMQVMTKVHGDKYEKVGGNLAAFDPITNLRVGAKVLQDCIARAGGSIEGGLRCYIGASDLEGDGGYVQKVLGERERVRAIAGGRGTPIVPARASAPAPIIATVAGAENPAQVEKVAALLQP